MNVTVKMISFKKYFNYITLKSHTNTTQRKIIKIWQMCTLLNVDKVKLTIVIIITGWSLSRFFAWNIWSWVWIHFFSLLSLSNLLPLVEPDDVIFTCGVTEETEIHWLLSNLIFEFKQDLMLMLFLKLIWGFQRLKVLLSYILILCIDFYWKPIDLPVLECFVIVIGISGVSDFIQIKWII